MKSNTNLTGNWWETEIAHQIITKKYMHEDETTFEQFIHRVSGIFSDELKLYAAGAKGKFKASTSNCYCMRSPDDNIEDIFEVAKETARIFSMGGGVGINVSKLRPNGAKVCNAAKTSTGAVSFLNIFNSVGEVIGANNRRK